MHIRDKLYALYAEAVTRALACRQIVTKRDFSLIRVFYINKQIPLMSLAVNADSFLFAVGKTRGGVKRVFETVRNKGAESRFGKRKIIRDIRLNAQSHAEIFGLFVI